MIQATIKGKTVSIPQGWQDVTLDTYILYITQIEPKAPKKIRELWSAKGKARQDVLDSITQIEYANEFLPFFVEVCAFWLDIDTNLLYSVNKDELEALYFQIEKNLSRSYEEIAKVQAQTIEHNGTVWHLPKKLMQGSTVIEFIESAQFEHNADKVQNNQYAALPDLMCVLLRKEGEQYSPELMQRRSMWLTMTMDKAFQVAFFLLKRSEKLGKDFLFYMMASKMLSQKGQELTSSTKALAGI